MKKLIAVTAVVVAGWTIAVPVAKDLTKLSPDELKAHRERIIMEKQGGFVAVKGTPCGSIAVVNAQKKVAASNFDITKQKSLKDFSTIVKTMEVKAAPFAEIAKIKADAKADFAVFIVDDKTLPVSLVAPEEKWGIVNVAALEPGAATPEVVRIRARNEFARVFAMTCGGFSSQYDSALMNHVKDVADLENCLDDLPVDMASRVISHLRRCGVRPIQRVTYRRACQEGWAAQPTNEFQKAVWDSIHTLPTKPLVIKPETK